MSLPDASSRSRYGIVADLHIHSSVSDGCLSPEGVVRAAQRIGLSFIALTDHDSTDGFAQARAAACAFSNEGVISVIPGVEITTQTDGRAVHILGYFIKTNDDSVTRYLAENRARRTQRALAIAENLAKDGYAVDAEELKAAHRSVNRMHLARQLVRKGYVRNTDEAFRLLIGETSAYYVHVDYISTREGVQFVNDIGGTSFIAHAAHYGVEDLIPSLIKEGLHGIEVYHTMHSTEDEESLLGCAREWNLAVSGGSDWHGDATHGAELGGSGLTQVELMRFFDGCSIAPSNPCSEDSYE